MEALYTKIIETLIVGLLYVIIKGVSSRLIKKTLNDRLIQKSRGAAISRIIHLVLISICIVFILLIWGVRQSDLAVFVGSVLTIVGVAFFAQWSLLSNITSSIILFFNHPVRVGDNINILEAKEYVIEGKVTSIGLFFTTLLTTANEELVLPNNLFIQKSIVKKNKHSKSKSLN